MNKGRLILSTLMAAVLLSSCQQGILTSSRGSSRYDSPDAVTRLSQVDSYYRSAFASQQGSNYSLAEQRKAFYAAAKTARTPVPKSMPKGKVASSKRKSSKRRRS